MLLEALIEICVSFIIGLFDFVSLSGISLLVDAAGVLSNFCVYGSYIVGADLLFVFGGLVLTWTLAKLSVGVGIRLWELLPFT